MRLLTRLLGSLSSAPAGHAPATAGWPLDMPVLALPGGDAWRLADACEGTFILGATGSGKTSGSGNSIASAFLRAGFGGVILCSKPGEAGEWYARLEASGRAQDLIWFHADGELCFNPFAYEVGRPDGAGRESHNLVNLMLTIMDAAQRGEGGGREEQSFWRRASAQNLALAMTPLVTATGTLRLDDLMQFLISAPRSRAEAASAEWKERSFCYHILRKAHDDPAGEPLPLREMRVITDHWFVAFAELDDRTRSNILATITSTISPFLTGRMHRLLCTDTHFIPEMTHEGAILIVDFPVKVWGDMGVVVANVLKYQWQRATERRAVHAGTRPVFLWTDECQFTVSAYDMEFQSTARSSRACSVYLTQNLPGLYSQLKGSDPRATANALLGHFQTQIFHSNSDPTTNTYAADLIGRAVQRRFSQNWSSSETDQTSESVSSNWGLQKGTSKGRNWGSSSSFGSSTDSKGNTSSSSSYGSTSGAQVGSSRSRSVGGGYSTSESASVGNTDGGGWSEQVDYVIQPSVFARRLRKGGRAEGGLVDGILVQGGRRFQQTGAHWLHCVFKQ